MNTKFLLSLLLVTLPVSSFAADLKDYLTCNVHISEKKLEALIEQNSSSKRPAGGLYMEGAVTYTLKTPIKFKNIQSDKVIVGTQDGIILSFKENIKAISKEMPYKMNLVTDEGEYYWKKLPNGKVIVIDSGKGYEVKGENSLISCVDN